VLLDVLFQANIDRIFVVGVLVIDQVVIRVENEYFENLLTGLFNRNALVGSGQLNFEIGRVRSELTCCAYEVAALIGLLLDLCEKITEQEFHFFVEELITREQKLFFIRLESNKVFEKHRQHRDTIAVDQT